MESHLPENSISVLSTGVWWFTNTERACKPADDNEMVSFAALVIWEGNTFAEALVKRFTRKQCSLPEKNEIQKRERHTCFSSRNSQIRKHRCVLYPPTTGKKRKKWKKNNNTKMKRHGRKGQPWAIRHADGGCKGWRGASFERQSSTCASGHFTRRVYHLCIPCRTDNV